MQIYIPFSRLPLAVLIGSFRSSLLWKNSYFHSSAPLLLKKSGSNFCAHYLIHSWKQLSAMCCKGKYKSEILNDVNEKCWEEITSRQINKWTALAWNPPSFSWAYEDVLSLYVGTTFVLVLLSGCLVVQQGYIWYWFWLQDNYIHVTRNDVYSERRLYSIFSTSFSPCKAGRDIQESSTIPFLCCAFLLNDPLIMKNKFSDNPYALYPYCTCSTTLQVFFSLILTCSNVSPFCLSQFTLLTCKCMLLGSMVTTRLVVSLLS